MAISQRNVLVKMGTGNDAATVENRTEYLKKLKTAAIGFTNCASGFYLKKRLTEKGICIHLAIAASLTRGKIR